MLKMGLIVRVSYSRVSCRRVAVFWLYENQTYYMVYIVGSYIDSFHKDFTCVFNYVIGSYMYNPLPGDFRMFQLRYWVCIYRTFYPAKVFITIGPFIDKYNGAQCKGVPKYIGCNMWASCILDILATHIFIWFIRTAITSHKLLRSSVEIIRAYIEYMLICVD